MPKTVNNPPALIPQQAPGWCFAAAEQMARNFYNRPARTQYDIARRIVIALVDIPDPDTYDDWLAATLYDEANGLEENNGANLQSARVQLVRSRWGAVNYNDIGGYIANNYGPQDFRDDIDRNKIIIGNANHFFVVYGYEDAGDFTLLLRDPWPENVGGRQQSVRYNTFTNWNDRQVIRFN
ncbi:hypothetical protein [Dyella acidiphila]|uniref:Peptidase C39-like domain-containing protein n=1 Tax=Dyella acidiphila TaxID=2775866 RepID=A0ABR9GBT6_9GAMM|nr:hypothetical protein [Dyella acidiphila]MBE1161469.1 hypothetical protein [Dyella acidiphila]